MTPSLGSSSCHSSDSTLVKFLPCPKAWIGPFLMIASGMCVFAHVHRCRTTDRANPYFSLQRRRGHGNGKGIAAKIIGTVDNVLEARVSMQHTCCFYLFLKIFFETVLLSLIRPQNACSFWTFSISQFSPHTDRHVSGKRQTWFYSIAVMPLYIPVHMKSACSVVISTHPQRSPTAPFLPN